ncbi:hypothetical protein L1987_27186 [Smallanthus sonchifolius]|uniref:Uncharacterized protein n=1 Tax=Smallanthus sonchifolius TaxID=185202 RepID=A0ACB9IBH5_9ASTR|nr:hypothetical protein L1987_27186 [Smallanthus sonchifolius]
MEVALQLIQLSGESDADLYPHELSNSASEASTTARKRRRRRRNEIVNDAESTTARFITPWFHHDDGDGDGVAGNRRKRKKYRSVVEIYEYSGDLDRDNVISFFYFCYKLSID